MAHEWPSSAFCTPDYYAAVLRGLGQAGGFPIVAYEYNTVHQEFAPVRTRPGASRPARCPREVRAASAWIVIKWVGTNCDSRVRHCYQDLAALSHAPEESLW
jgi:hypothetical protein